MNDEVIRVIKLLGKFNPAENDDEKVASENVIMVTFKLG